MIFKIWKKNEEDNLTITLEHMELKSQFYGVNKKFKNAGNIGFKFNQIKKNRI